MIPENFSVEPASWEADLADLRAVREQVFLIEQAIPPEDEWDALDARSHHVLARDHDRRPIGTGRLVPPQSAIQAVIAREAGAQTPDSSQQDRPPTPAGIGRMAVLAGWRGQGVGAAIVRVLLEQARALRYPAIELHAQSHALAFYAKFGFEPCGEEFEECGIAHWPMRLTLEPTIGRQPPALAPKPEARTLLFDDRDQALAAVADLLADARFEIAIYTRDLDPALFDVPATLDALKRIALSGRNARIRVLVQDARTPLADGHRLIALAQRLSSAIALRTPVDERDLQYPSAFLITDRRGYLFRVLGSRLEGEGSTYAPGRHAQLREFFDQVWERSVPSEELRQLAV
ncbi:MAG: GNAT family N-acetyltransferase [Lysobacterales bacterium]